MFVISNAEIISEIYNQCGNLFHHLEVHDFGLGKEVNIIEHEIRKFGYLFFQRFASILTL
jgi:hypothetical protein